MEDDEEYEEVTFKIDKALIILVSKILEQNLLPHDGEDTAIQIATAIKSFN